MSLPDRLGRLRRLRRLGVGAFATVWLYHDAELDSAVAVKALADNWSQRDDVRDRFLAEARILRRAENDHIVRVYDIGESGDTPYFVMTYADGGSLAGGMRPGVPMSPNIVADHIAQAGVGLAALHRHGIIHRDIKPNNLLLRSDTDGRARVLVADLGVAKAALHASGITQVVGTPAYMAPEQAIGIGIDQRADVHALGAVAYQLLTGQLARQGLIDDLSEARLPPPPTALATLPAEVDDIVLRALEPNPDDRWPDVCSFTAALSTAVARPLPGTDRETEVRQDADAPLVRQPPHIADTLQLQDTGGTAVIARPTLSIRPQPALPELAWMRVATPADPPEEEVEPEHRRGDTLAAIAVVIFVIAVVLGASYAVYLLLQ